MKVLFALAVPVFGLVMAVSAGAGTPTRTTWASAANSTCRVAYAKIRQLPKATTPTLVLRDARATLRIARPMDAQVAAIPRPASEGARIAALVSNSHTQEALFAEVIDALAAGRSVQSKIQKLGVLGDRYNRLARGLGASICAQNPQPSG